MAYKLEHKIAVVTGGTTGIGLATAKRFVEEGARVFVTGRRQDALDAAVAALGENVTGVRADSSKSEDLDRLFARVASEHGHLDVLFVNAGGGTMLPLGEITEAQFEDTFGRNVKGALFTVQKALPLLSTGASVILTASTTSVKGTAAFSVYSASKAAVRNLVRSWILDVKGRGIRINVISPGPIETPGLRALAGTPELEAELFGNLASHVPLGRLGRPEEIAKAAVFLASDDASFVNGIELFVDGGLAQV
ncbi:MAG: SDR family oxidoreductase [Gemmatimonadaceae bacterium]|nr:SDR family oxidoreductase [Gemmatimonadaceae bacterium]